MSAGDIAKDVVRLASTHGLSKDVIDLLEKKVSLLVDENAKLSTQVSRLEIENAQLRQQLQHFQPAGGIPKQTDDVLQFFFDHGDDLSVEEIAQKFQFQMSVAEYHFDLLRKRAFVHQTRMGFQTYGGSSPAMFGLTSEGRAYVMQRRA
jgi:hypothetical protein